MLVVMTQPTQPIQPIAAIAAIAISFCEKTPNEDEGENEINDKGKDFLNKVRDATRISTVLMVQYGTITFYKPS